jgi:hypothetical protein
VGRGHARGRGPCEVEGVADEEADPLVLCDDEQQNQLCEIEGEIHREEGIRVDVKGIRPFDGGPGTPGQAAPTLWGTPVVTTWMEGGKDDGTRIMSGGLGQILNN